VRELMRSQTALRVVEPQPVEPVAELTAPEPVAEPQQQAEPVAPVRRVHRRKAAQADQVQP
jgi:hypothetical protein